MLDRRLLIGSLGALAGCAAQPGRVAGLAVQDQIPPLAPVRAHPDRLFDITVCLRPFRAAGPRLDTEMLGDTLVVHNYGHGGSGWSLSWGSAAIAVGKAMERGRREIAVIGCGALGLTSAIQAQRAGASVTIYCKELIQQARSARATGGWTPDSRIALDKEAAYVEGIAEEVRALGGTIHTMTADLMDVAQCEQVIPAVLRQFGPIDGIANIAGGTRGEEWVPLDETPTDSFRKTMALNFEYVFYLCRDIAREWIRTDRPGVIVNIGSVSAKDAAPWHGPYGAGKSAIIALTRTMAHEWHEFGIRANSVSPGAVMSERVLAKSAAMPEAAKAGRDPNEIIILSEPVELANTITFLLSDLASGISGHNLVVDRSLSTKFCGGRRLGRKRA